MKNSNRVVCYFATALTVGGVADAVRAAEAKTNSNSVAGYSTVESMNSDHSKVVFDGENGLTIVQFNIAQPNTLQFFANPYCPEGFNWSTVLRTPEMLEKVRDHKGQLNALMPRLLEAAQQQFLTVEEKNKHMKEVSQELIPYLVEMGFSVKSMHMGPNKLFNPGVSPNDLRQSPEKYIHGPQYALEDAESYKGRLERAVSELFMNAPDIAITQEITLGTDNTTSIDYTHIFQQVFNQHPEYGYTLPTLTNNNVITLSLTYVNKERWSDISDASKAELDSIQSKLKCFQDSDVKMSFRAFQHISSKQIWYVANIHADYSKTNRQGNAPVDPWGALKETLISTPNLIVGGDFNLQLKNIAFLEDMVKDTNVSYVKLETPEPVEFNPTYDAIFVSKGR